MMTNEQEEALDTLLNYVLADEARDYADSVEEPDQNHIYHAIYVLAKMRGWNVDSPEELRREEQGRKPSGQLGGCFVSGRGTIRRGSGRGLIQISARGPE